MYDTRGNKYVAVRGKAYHRGSGTRYVAFRSDDVSRSFGRHRYGAVYDVDYGLARSEARRYLAVRSAPRVRYVAVRNIEIDDDYEPRYVAVRRIVPRTRYVAVRHIDLDDDDEPRYVAVRRIVPRTKYVAVRNVDIDDDDDAGYVKLSRIAPRTKYVPVRNIDNGCTRAIALRSCLNEIETTSVKRVVLRDDDADLDANYIAVKNEIDDDDEYVLKNEMDDDHEYVAVSRRAPRYVEYRDASYTYETPVAMRTRTITYTTDDDDMDDQAFIGEGDTTYVAVADTDDACLSSHVVGTSPVSYVAVDPDDDDVGYVAAEASLRPRYVALDDDQVFDDLDPTWVEEQADTNAVSYVPVESVMGTDAYVAVDDMDDTVRYVADHDVDRTVSYAAVDDLDNVHTQTVSYVPVEVMAQPAVRYVPVNDVDDVDVRYVADDACPISVSSVYAEPVYVADTSTVLVEEVDTGLVAALSATQRIAGTFGYRDGFEDGQDAALEGDVYHPENSGDFQKATEGYEDDYGDKDVYKDAYRDSYLDGYRAGFKSGNSV